MTTVTVVASGETPWHAWAVRARPHEGERVSSSPGQQACVGVRSLCDERLETSGENVHRCFLDQDHGERFHVCICFHRWPVVQEA